MLDNAYDPRTNLANYKYRSSDMRESAQLGKDGCADYYMGGTTTYTITSATCSYLEVKSVSVDILDQKTVLVYKYHKPVNEIPPYSILMSVYDSTEHWIDDNYTAEYIYYW